MDTPTIWDRNGTRLYRFRKVVNGIKLRKTWALTVPLDKIQADIAQLIAAAHNRAAPLLRPKPTPTTTIEDVAKMWADHLTARSLLPRAHDKSAYAKSSLRNATQSVVEFRKIYGKLLAPEMWDAIIDYRMKLGRRIAASELKPVTVNTRIQLIKSLANWAYDEELIDVAPRKFSKRTSKFTDNRKPKTVSLDDAATLYKNAPDYLKHLILSALNTGAGAGELINKDKQSIKVIDGITYFVGARNKTQIEFRYKLWPEVVSRVNGDFPFPSYLGRRITHESTINRALYRVQRILGWKRRVSFYAFRHLGASLVEGIDRHMTSIYLAHKIEGMKSVYITREDLYPKLDVVTDKLREVVMGKFTA